MGIGAALATAGDGALSPADGGGLSGHFDDHVLLLLFLNFLRKCKKRRHSAFTKHRRWGDGLFGFGAVPLLTGKQKSPAAFPEGKNGWALVCSFWSWSGLCPFCGNWPVQKGHRSKTAQKGELCGFKSCRSVGIPVWHLSFDWSIFTPEKVRKHLMPCGFFRMASKVFGLVGADSRT